MKHIQWPTVLFERHHGGFRVLQENRCVCVGGGQGPVWSGHGGIHRQYGLKQHFSFNSGST